MELIIAILILIPVFSVGVFVLMFVFKIYDCCNSVIETCKAINAFLEKEQSVSQHEDEHIDIETT